MCKFTQGRGEREMSTQDKSLKLAELMGWTVKEEFLGTCVITPLLATMGKLEPYEESTIGLAQAHAILLKFPEVMSRIHYRWWFGARWTDEPPTQADILDCILRMNGVEI